ncbi:hypothetical protein [uncultured Trichococcus sp.]|uniref:hypothetical protein n=1 Tax=uncultured Trichococcus sp. TaxID=189665 RepID=UPI0029C85BF2|nr:hypothetical protein [uncultured Trichococcus sp.]
MPLQHILFLLFLATKPFYLFPSGGLQLSDLFFVASCFYYVLIVKKGDKIEIDKTDKPLFLFVVFVFIVNTVYATYYGEPAFVISSLYYLYNLLIVIFFRIYAEDRRFLSSVAAVCRFNILSQLGIYLAGLGRYYTANRYMGTFNDPNQMAFFIYISLMTAYLIAKLNHKELHVLYHAVAIVLIFQTSSTGMLLALTVFYGVWLLTKIFTLLRRVHSVRFILFWTAALMALLLFSPKWNDVKESIAQSPIIERVEQKLGRIEVATDGPTNLQDRGIDRIYLYPEKTLFGAGEGMHGRFDRAVSDNEIHSTLFSILFYYGTAPTLLFLYWVVRNVRRLSIGNLAVIVSLAVESVTLLNQRQPLFWMLFVLLQVLAFQEIAERERDSIAVETDYGGLLKIAKGDDRIEHSLRIDDIRDH